jgi:predicted transcriptional regulator
MGQTISVRLEDDILKQLDMMAKTSDRSRSWLMAQAIKQYVEHEAWQVEAIQKSLAALETGKAKFALHADVAEWLASWGSDAEQDRPQCK